MVRFLLSNYGRKTSYNRLKNAFGLHSVHTAADYVSCAEDAFLLLTVERYSAKTLSRYTMPRKVYAIDQSFMGRREEGRVLENVAFLESSGRSATTKQPKSTTGGVKTRKLISLSSEEVGLQD